MKETVVWRIERKKVTKYFSCGKKYPNYTYWRSNVGRRERTELCHNTPFEYHKILFSNILTSISKLKFQNWSFFLLSQRQDFWTEENNDVIEVLKFCQMKTGLNYFFPGLLTGLPQAFFRRVCYPVSHGQSWPYPNWSTRHCLVLHLILKRKWEEKLVVVACRSWFEYFVLPRCKILMAFTSLCGPCESLLNWDIT